MKWDFPYLNDFEGDWPAYELVKQALADRRKYKSRLAKKTEKPADDDDDLDDAVKDDEDDDGIATELETPPSDNENSDTPFHYAASPVAPSMSPPPVTPPAPVQDSPPLVSTISNACAVFRSVLYTKIYPFYLGKLHLG